MIPRKLEPKLRALAGYYPVVAVTGPRQSGETVSTDYFKNLHRFSERVNALDRICNLRSYVLYGGDVSQKRSDARLLSWREIAKLLD